MDRTNVDYGYLETAGSLRFCSFLKRFPAALLPALLCLALSTSNTVAQTWLGVNDDWWDSSNWNPAGAPNDSGAALIFPNSPTTTIRLTNNVSAASFTFAAGAPAYTIRLTQPVGFLNVFGPGFINFSAQEQTISVESGSALFFQGSATVQGVGAGINVAVQPGGSFMLRDNSSGGNARLVSHGSTALITAGGAVSFGSLEGTGTINAHAGFPTQMLTVGSLGTDTTFAGQLMDGSAQLGLKKEGAGDLTLTGNNTYTGGTVVTDGALIVSADGNLGDASGTLTLDGGILQTAGSFTSARSIVLGAGDGSIDTDGHTLTLTGVVSGPGALLKECCGTVVLTGTNTYQGGTGLAGGTVQVSSDANLGDVSGTVYFAGGTLRTTSTFTMNRPIDLYIGGQIETDDGTTLTLAGPVSESIGVAGLEKTGNGTLVFAGASTYLSPTTVTAGNLVVNGAFASSDIYVDSGATLSGSGTIAGDVTIENGGTLKGAVGGTPFSLASLTLGGAAKVSVTLGAASALPLFTVVGNVTLDGQLNVDGDGSFTTGSHRLLNYGGMLTDNGLILGATPLGYDPSRFAITVGGGQVNLTVSALSSEQYWDGGNGAWNALNANWTDPNGTGRSAWRGAIGVFRDGTGAVMVDGAQSFTALRFEGDGYSLQPLAGASLGIGGAQGAVRIDSGMTAEIATPITGQGQLAKAGGGTLILSAPNTYGGGSFLAGGTLSVSADENLGAASGGLTFDGGTLEAKASFASAREITLGAGNGTIEVETGKKLTLSGSIAGGGSLGKDGGGTLALAGRSSYSGPTLVQSGTLKVNGALASTVTLASGATLMGTGEMGGLLAQRGSTVAPGNSIGSMSVNGNATFAAGSIYRLEADAAGRSDVITVTGKATLQGGKLQVQAEAGEYRAATAYRILAASGGVFGRFDTVTSNFAFLSPSLGYDAQNVTLTLTRTDLGPRGFASFAISPNQYRIARAIEALGEGNPVYDAVLGQSVSGAQQAFDSLSGEIHGSATAAVQGGTRLTQDTLLARLRQRMGQPRGATVPAAYAADRPGATAQSVPVPFPTFDPRRFAIWGEGFGSWGKADATSNAATVDISTGGFMIGADAGLDPDYRIGIAGGFTRTSFEANARLSTGTTESTVAGIYGSARWREVVLRGGATYAHHDIDVARSIRFPGFADQATSSYDGSTVLAFGEVGYEAKWDRVRVEPFLGASILRLRTNRFLENGGAAALIGLGHDYDIGTTTLGLRSELQLSADVPLTVHGMIGWQRAYSDIVPTSLLAFPAGDSTFGVSGVPVDRDAFLTEAGLNWQASDAIDLGVAYQSQIGSLAQRHSLKGHLTWRF